MNGELPAWTDPALVRALLDANDHRDIPVTKILDVYPDSPAGSLVMRLTRGDRLRFNLDHAYAVRHRMRRPALREAS